MSLRPFFEASLAVQIHEITAILAFILGALVLWRRKGNASHKFWGRIWVVSMLITSLTSIFIHSIKLWGNYSPIHILTAVVIINLPLAVWFARRGKIETHRRIMQGTYLGGMLIAGSLTFLPGRMNYEIILGEGTRIGSNWAGVIIIAGLFFIGGIGFRSYLNSRNS